MLKGDGEASMTENVNDETDQKILNAFDQLTIKYGYKGATTRRIAQLAGVNESTIFRHFPTKEDILDRQVELSMGEIEHIIDDFQFTDDLEADIIQMGLIYLQYVQNHQATFLLGIRDSYQYPKVQKAIQRLPEKMMELLLKRFEREQLGRKTTELERIVKTLFLTLYGRAAMQLTYPSSKILDSDQEFIEKDFQELVHYLLSGWCE